MSNTNFSVKNLLIESRINDNLEYEINRFKEYSSLLKEYSRHNKSLSSLNESLGDDLLSELLTESADTFKKARKNLSNAKSCEEVNKIHESLKIANKHLNDLESKILNIEDIMENTITQLENHHDNPEYQVVEGLNEAMNLKYLHINFLMGEDAERGFEILRRDGKRGLISYLKQFRPTGHIKPESTPNFTRHDNKFRVKDYIFYYNDTLGYMGVDKIVSKN